MRYLVSADGLKVEQQHRMHYSLLQFSTPKDAKDVTTFRTAVLDDAPEDTDVATVLMMGGTPCLVATRKYVYRVEATGDIHYLSNTETLKKTR